MQRSQELAALAIEELARGRSLGASLPALLAREPALTAAQRGFVRELAYGTARWKGRLGAALAALAPRPPRDEALVALLLVALYQLWQTRAPAPAVVDQAVRAAERIAGPRSKGFVNAVLRRFARERDGVLEAAARGDEGRWSHPQWWIDRLRQDHPEHWQAILEAGNERPPMTLRVNRRRITREDYEQRLREAGMACEPVLGDGLILGRPCPVEALPGFRDGLCSVQDAGAQHAAVLLDARAGMRVLDACAAPGGKTAHVLERAEVEALAIDESPERLAQVAENLERLGLRARLAPGDAATPSAWWDGRPFDRILADVPCTASGVVRRHPDAKWLRRPSDLPSLAGRQRAILGALWPLLVPGGRLLYATCSVFAAENGDQAREFLERHADARALPIDPGEAGAGQLLPGSRGAAHNHDGFFYALFEKRRDPND